MDDSGTTPSPTMYALLDAAGVPSRAQTPGFNPRIDRLTVDSRDVAPGTCFIALRGTKVDGHQFVPQALAAGATAVVVQSGCFDGDCPVAVFVPDTHEALARLAASFYGVDEAQRAGRLTLVGVTGTNGKTTACALVRGVLQSAGYRTASLGTICNDTSAEMMSSGMTTLPPLELCARLAAALRAGATHAVLEVSSHALDQRRTAGLEFSVGVFTNLTQDHLDYHRDMEEYARAKKRLFDALQPAAAAVVGADDPYARAMVADCAARVLRYGLDDANLDVHAERVHLGLHETRFELRVRGEGVPLISPLIGRHNVRNLLAAAGAATALGIPLDHIRRGLEAVSCVRGRLQRVEGADRFEVLVDYAHTPDALINVLGLLREVTPNRLICVFGCGGDRDRGKRPLMGRAVASLTDIAIVTSDNPRSEDPQAIIADTLEGMAHPRGEVICEADRRVAIARAIHSAEPGDVVLIAGKGHEDYQIVGPQRLWFDDAVVAAEALRQIREVA